MELLYFIDRSVTRLIQALSKLLSLKFKLHLFVQVEIFNLVGIVLVLMNALFYEEDAFRPNLLLAIVYLLGMMFFTQHLLFGIGIVLVVLHRIFDPEGYSNPDKLFSDGYMAWTLVIFWGIMYSTYRLNDQTDLAFVQIAFVYLVLPGRIYYRFATRIPSDQNKGRKKVMTEAFRQLLERCRSWLPTPQPAAG